MPGPKTEEELDLDNPPAVWDQIEKFDLDDPVLADGENDVRVRGGKPQPEELPAPAYADGLRQLPEGGRAAIVRRCSCHAPAGRTPSSAWPNGGTAAAKGSSYDRLSAEAAAILKIEDHLPDLEIDQLVDVMTFLAVEKRIASSLRERVQTTADTINAEDVRTIARRRQAGHWASPTVADSPDAPRRAFHAVYDALVAAADFYALRNQHQGGFDYPDAASMYRAYETELYRFDQLYRHFCEGADLVEANKLEHSEATAS